MLKEFLNIVNRFIRLIFIFILFKFSPSIFLELTYLTYLLLGHLVIVKQRILPKCCNEKGGSWPKLKKKFDLSQIIFCL